MLGAEKRKYMPVFRINKENIIEENITISDKNDINHISNVLRLNIGDSLELIDENTTHYKTIIKSIDKNKIVCEIAEKEISKRQLNFRLDLAQCIVKAQAQDMIIQKMTELGVKNMYTFPSKYSVVQLKGKDISQKIERWNKIAAETLKQCERADKPNIFYLDNIFELEKIQNNYDLVIACVERNSQNSIKNILREKKCNSVLVIIGPEGGFCDKELEFFEKSKFKMATISNLILRAPTAAICALNDVVYEYEL